MEGRGLGVHGVAAAAAVEKGGSAARYACRPVTEQVMVLYSFDKGCTESCAPGKVIEQVWKIWGSWAVGVSQEAGPAGMESAAGRPPHIPV